MENNSGARRHTLMQLTRFFHMFCLKYFFLVWGFLRSFRSNLKEGQGIYKAAHMLIYVELLFAYHSVLSYASLLLSHLPLFRLFQSDWIIDKEWRKSERVRHQDQAREESEASTSTLIQTRMHAINSIRLFIRRRSTTSSSSFRTNITKFWEIFS